MTLAVAPTKMPLIACSRVTFRARSEATAGSSGGAAVAMAAGAGEALGGACASAERALAN